MSYAIAPAPAYTAPPPSFPEPSVLPLPYGWITETAPNGRPYFVNTLEAKPHAVWEDPRFRNQYAPPGVPRQTWGQWWASWFAAPAQRQPQYYEQPPPYGHQCSSAPAMAPVHHVIQAAPAPRQAPAPAGNGNFLWGLAAGAAGTAVYEEFKHHTGRNSSHGGWFGGRGWGNGWNYDNHNNNNRNHNHNNNNHHNNHRRHH